MFCFPQFVCFFQLLTLGGFSDEIAHSTKGRITDTGVWKILFRSVNLFLPPRTGKIVIFLISQRFLTFFFLGKMTSTRLFHNCNIQDLKKHLTSNNFPVEASTNFSHSLSRQRLFNAYSYLSSLRSSSPHSWATNTLFNIFHHLFLEIFTYSC